MGSSAENASSISKMAGSDASARASPTRCCMPPESSSGYWPPQPPRPTCSSACAACRWRSSRGTPASSRPNAVLSSTVMCGISANDWNTMLMSLRRSARKAAAGSALMSCPSITTRPAVGSISPLSMRTSVDLPEPDSPMMTNSSPASMVKSASNTPMDCPVFSRICCLPAPSRASASACWGWLPNTLKTCSTRICLAMRRTPCRRRRGRPGDAERRKAKGPLPIPWFDKPSMNRARREKAARARQTRRPFAEGKSGARGPWRRVMTLLRGHAKR